MSKHVQGFHQAEFIFKIKQFRCFTKFLGTLGIKCLARENGLHVDALRYRASQGLSPYPPKNSKAWDTFQQYTYGLGLKEAKDMVERMYPELAKLEYRGNSGQ